jgi:putative NADH-flavin reductase
MTRITVLGGTGYAGAHIVREAIAQGHHVTSFSRTVPEAPVEGATYLTGSVLDDAVLDRAVADTDVVVSALAPRGELAGRTGGVLSAVAARCADLGVRFGVIGGAGSLLTSPGGPRVMDDEHFPADYLDEAREMAGVLDDLRGSGSEGDWFYVSPAAGFGAHAPGERTGRYRIGGDVLLTDDSGASDVSGADLAVAVVAEIENPVHRNARFLVTY